MMMARILWEAGSVILMLIGIMHLRGTFFTELLHPTDKKLREEMKIGTLQVDPGANLWKAWIGFNASFSICVLSVGFIYFYLAYRHCSLLQGELILSIAAILCTVLMTWIASRFLLKKVTRIFLISCICFIIATLMEVIK